ncbi:MAG: beta-ketoacyl synthase [Cellvibrionales bacterium]|jgi:acetoacetyl-[acyl-carrier protein] synthase
MLHLPLIVAAGGINSAGRTSHRRAYERMVIDALPGVSQSNTRAALAALMGTSDAASQDAGTLIRRIEGSHFDPAAVPWARRVTTDGAVDAHMAPTQLTDSLPEAWQPRPGPGKRTSVSLAPQTELLLPGSRPFEVGAAGILPTGFDPGTLYASRNHPRALQMTVFALSDALADLGLDWQDVEARVAPDAISVYASSSMGQLDEDGTGGMLRGRAMGRRVTSKQCPLGFAEMPGDFINAYILKSLGNTGPALGACATFLYNLRLAVQDIRSGRARVAIVGAAEAPVVAEVMEGYAAMGALASDRELRALDNLEESADPDWRRACRPFGDNCGFTMAESAQFVILFDDALALELGAPVLGAVPDVFVSADGPKKSISGPGAGNFVTVAKAAGLLNTMLGDKTFRGGGVVQSHGTSTPQNRVTESQILSQVAQAFGVDSWTVGAIKSFTGHSLGAAAGDQLSAMLGIWQTGLMAGITTVDRLAEDVETARLTFPLATAEMASPVYALVNSKGFGGNNATAAVLGPEQAAAMLKRCHGSAALSAWAARHESVQQRRESVENARLAGDWTPDYFFDDGVITPDTVAVSRESVSLGGRDISLKQDLPEGWSAD